MPEFSYCCSAEGQEPDSRAEGYKVRYVESPGPNLERDNDASSTKRLIEMKQVDQ
jgi:hypothetical protein